MSKATITKPSLLEAILINLKGGDDKKVLKFTQRLEKYYKIQMAAREANIEKLQDQLSDAEENLQDRRVSIEVSEISSATNLDSYCESYVQGLHNQSKEVARIKEAIAAEEKAIETLTELRDFNL